MPIIEEHATLIDFKQTDEYQQTAQKIWKSVVNNEEIDLNDIEEPCAYQYFSELYKLYKLYNAKKITQEDSEKQAKKLYDRYCENYDIRVNAMATNFRNQQQKQKCSSLYDKLQKSNNDNERLELSLEIIKLIFKG